MRIDNPGVDPVLRQVRACSPGLLALTTDFSITSVTFLGGDVKKLIGRNAQRIGLIFMVDPAITGGLAILPKSFTPAVGVTLPTQTGIAYVTCDLWQGSLMSEWYGFAALAGTVQVLDMYNL